ncbi:MAG: tRNA (adenosine(37)-N6)-threonylcarbamoyltransferase complex ATPase subunit type 1 TsaE [Pseudomonadota bacterium]
MSTRAPAPTALTLDLADPAATARFGACLAQSLDFGDTLLLDGPIGAGKSHLARALIQSRAAAAGAPQPDVPSPTYTLVQSYEIGGGEIVHADLYRLGDTSELAELGLDSAFGTALCLVEWPDRLASLAPDGALGLSLRLRGDGRQATLLDPSAQAAGRARFLRDAMVTA